MVRKNRRWKRNWGVGGLCWKDFKDPDAGSWEYRIIQ